MLYFAGVYIPLVGILMGGQDVPVYRVLHHGELDEASFESYIVVAQLYLVFVFFFGAVEWDGYAVRFEGVGFSAMPYYGGLFFYKDDNVRPAGASVTLVSCVYWVVAFP